MSSKDVKVQEGIGPSFPVSRGEEIDKDPPEFEVESIPLQFDTHVMLVFTVFHLHPELPIILTLLKTPFISGVRVLSGGVEGIS